MNKRVEVIDVAKGICIVLVALHHSKLKLYFPEINHAMALFRMPLFFFLAGVFFKSSQKPINFVINKADTLLKPYFITLFSLYMMSIILGEPDSTSQLLGIFYGNGNTIEWTPLWFLTHLWCVFFSTYILFRYTSLASKSYVIKLVVILFFLFIGSSFLKTFWKIPVSFLGNEFNLPGLPFSLDIVLISISFFMSGSFLNQRVKYFVPSLYIFLFAILLLIVISKATQAHVNLNHRIYKEPFFATIGAISGIYIIMSISNYFRKNNFLKKIFGTFGFSSLFILIFHKIVGGMVYKFFMFANEGNYNFFIAMLSFLASISVPLLIKTIIFHNEFLKLFYIPLKSNKLLTRRRLEIPIFLSLNENKNTS